MVTMSPVEGTVVDLADLLTAAADGDEDAFDHLLNLCDGPLRRLAVAMLGDVAGERSMLDVWRTALDRSSATAATEPDAVRAWLSTIVVELAQARGVILDARPVRRPSVAPDRFLPAGHRWAGYWAVPPTPWAAEASSPRASAIARCVVATLPSVTARAVAILARHRGLLRPGRRADPRHRRGRRASPAPPRPNGHPGSPRTRPGLGLTCARRRAGVVVRPRTGGLLWPPEAHGDERRPARVQRGPRAGPPRMPLDTCSSRR